MANYIKHVAKENLINLKVECHRVRTHHNRTIKQKELLRINIYVIDLSAKIEIK